MQQRFYIGTLELLFEVEAELPLSQLDRLFLDPVLPVAKQVAIQMLPVENPEFPEGEASESERLKIWKTGQTEVRAYKSAGDWSSMSCLKPDGNVVISVKRSQWQTFMQNFRPWFHIHLEELLLRNRALLLHSASIEYRGEGILFTAPSETGKTTQTDLWHKYREGVTDINGDRTVLQWTEKGWYACGFPIYGGVVRCEQKAKPVKAVVIIRQGETDRIQELSTAEKVGLLYSQMTVPSTDSEYVLKAMELIEELVSQVKVALFSCTMEESAVQVLHQYLYGEYEHGSL